MMSSCAQGNRDVTYNSARYIPVPQFANPILPKTQMIMISSFPVIVVWILDAEWCNKSYSSYIYNPVISMV